MTCTGQKSTSLFTQILTSKCHDNNNGQKNYVYINIDQSQKSNRKYMYTIQHKTVDNYNAKTTVIKNGNYNVVY